jgi:uncharacterized protein YbjQ (UPF0145 family)
MLITTTPILENQKIEKYLGLVGGDAIVGANIFRDFFASVRDIIGGRAGGYEKALRGAKEAAIEDMVEAAKELGADAVVGVDLDYETVGDKMLMVSASGTAVRLAQGKAISRPT